MGPKSVQKQGFSTKRGYFFCVFADREQRRVGSCQLSVVSCQLSVVSCQLSVVSSQWAVVSCQGSTPASTAPSLEPSSPSQPFSTKPASGRGSAISHSTHASA